MNLFYKDCLKKPIAIFLPINSTPPMAKLIVKPNTNEKQRQSANSASKQINKN